MVPDRLQQAPRWIHWRYENGVKRPYSPRLNRFISATDPAHWMAFQQAKTWRVKDGGLGFALRWQDDLPNFAVVDLDDCLDEMGGPNKDAQENLKLVNSYTEVSPSGLGLKIFCEIEAPIKSVKTPGLEVLASVYATVTGLRLDDYEGCSETVNERTIYLENLSGWLQFVKDLERPFGESDARVEGPVPNGFRNESLFKHACSLRAEGLGYEEILEQMEGVNNLCEPPLPFRDVLSITRSACRYQPGSDL